MGECVTAFGQKRTFKYPFDTHPIVLDLMLFSISPISIFESFDNHLDESFDYMGKR